MMNRKTPVYQRKTLQRAIPHRILVYRIPEKPCTVKPSHGKTALYNITILKLKILNNNNNIIPPPTLLLLMILKIIKSKPHVINAIISNSRGYVRVEVERNEKKEIEQRRVYPLNPLYSGGVYSKMSIGMLKNAEERIQMSIQTRQQQQQSHPLLLLMILKIIKSKPHAISAMISRI